ncbi:hypothetical protein FCR2A7T_20380 [Flavobacterium cauense R2A-7]|nr:hypothetical protein FCR2A7T_20380 [Flavobacterium cauense R2A-7]
MKFFCFFKALKGVLRLFLFTGIKEVLRVGSLLYRRKNVV